MQRKPSVLACPRCSFVNASENKYCSSCSYPLIPSAFEEIKAAEDMKIQTIWLTNIRLMQQSKECLV